MIKESIPYECMEINFNTDETNFKGASLFYYLNQRHLEFLIKFKLGGQRQVVKGEQVSLLVYKDSYRIRMYRPDETFNRIISSFELRSLINRGFAGILPKPLSKIDYIEYRGKRNKVDW